MIVYDTRFDSNEWFVLTGLLVGYPTLFLLPKRFPLKTALVFVVCGIYSGFVYDHSLSVEPVDFYDVNDTSQYELVDFFSYLMYGPWSYLFFYGWDCLRRRSRLLPLYILLWGMGSVGMEKIATLCHVFHYKNGYGLFYSFPIYLITLSCWTVLYRAYKARRLG